jgi:hypothetical protein
MPRFFTMTSTTISVRMIHEYQGISGMACSPQVGSSGDPERPNSMPENSPGFGDSTPAAGVVMHVVPSPIGLCQDPRRWAATSPPA